MSSEYTLLISREIPAKLLRDIMTTAVEGGSNYWTSQWDVYRNFDLDVICVRNIKTPDGEICTDVFPSDIFEALDRMEGDERYSQTLWRILNEEYDALDADVVFQLATLGELVYG